MLKIISQMFIRITLLVVIVILGITIIFPGWYDNRHIILDEFTANFMSKDDLQIREEARRQNIPFKEHKAQILKKRANKKERELLAANLSEAIKNKNDQRLATLLSDANKQYFPKDLYVQAIEQNYVKGIEVIHNNGIKCTATKDQFQADPALFNAIGSIHYKTLDAVLASNSAVFEQWVALGCYQVHENIEQRLVKDKRLSQLLEDVSFLNTSNKLWERLLWRSVYISQVDIAEILLDGGVTFSDDLITSINKNRPVDERRMDMFSLLFQQGKYKLAESLLAKHPDYIGSNNLDQQVFDTLKNGPQLKGIYESFPSSLLQLDALESTLVIELEQAVKNGYLARVIWLLELDPSLNFSILDSTVDYSKLDKNLGFLNVKNSTLLLERDLDLSKLEYEGLDQLSAAIRNGEIEVVKLLLDENIPLNKLYRGKSILAINTHKKMHNKEGIRGLLIGNGAHNDLGKLVRQETGVVYDSKCKIGKPSISQYGTNTAFLSLINNAFEQSENNVTAVDNYEICHISLLVCTKNQSNSLDDCFESAPACAVDNEAYVFSKHNPITELCCPSLAKSRYNEMRCSGLGVLSASLMVADMGFPTVYSIPTFMMNTPEYQERERQEQQGDQQNFEK